MRGTYQGLTATVLKQGTNQAIRFYVMNSLRNWYKGENPPFHEGRAAPPFIVVCVSKATTPEKKCIRS